MCNRLPESNLSKIEKDIPFLQERKMDVGDDGAFYHKYARPMNEILEENVYEQDYEWINVVQNVEIIDEMIQEFFEVVTENLLNDPKFDTPLHIIPYQFREKPYTARICNIITVATDARCPCITLKGDGFCYAREKIKSSNIYRLYSLHYIVLRDDLIEKMPFIKDFAADLGCQMLITYHITSKSVFTKFLSRKTGEILIIFEFASGAPIFVPQEHLYI